MFRRLSRLIPLLGVLTLATATPVHARSLNDIRTARFGDVGFLRQIDCPISGRYDCLSFPRNLYELNGDCFTLELGATLPGYNEAMLVQFRSGAFGVMTKTGYGRDRFEIFDIERMYDCPDLY